MHAQNDILLIGQHTQAFLHAVADDMQKYGFLCETVPQEPITEDGARITLSIDDYGDSHTSMQCCCCELDLIDAKKKLATHTDLLKQAKHIIVVLPIKAFPYYRYNVDNSLVGISDWIVPNQLQKIIHHAIHKTDITLSWVVVGAERVARTLMDPNPIVTLSQIHSAKDLSGLKQMMAAAVEKFFFEKEETRFLERCGEGETVSFGFLSGSTQSEIGEQTCACWNVFAFAGAVQDKLPLETIFEDL